MCAQDRASPGKARAGKAGEEDPTGSEGFPKDQLPEGEGFPNDETPRGEGFPNDEPLGRAGILAAKGSCGGGAGQARPIVNIPGSWPPGPICS